ncbi:MAG: hypothetical protein D6763_07530, partial [Alphaproteobacteria bacterium]
MNEARVYAHIRSAMRLIRWVLIGILVLLAGLLVRLHLAPIPLDFLKPVVSRALVFGDRGLRLAFEEGALAWGRADGLRDDWSFLELDLHGVKLIDAESRPLLTLPQSRVRLSGVALLAGRIAPAALDVEGLELRLAWDGGDIVGALRRIGAEEPAATTPAALILGLLAPPDRNETAGYLQQVNIADALVVLDENLSGSQWRLTNTRLRFSRGTDRMLISGDGLLSRDGHDLTRLDLAGIYSARSKASHVELLFDHLNPSEIAGDSEALAALKAVDMALSGSLGATFGADRVVREVNFDLSGGRGLIELAGLYPEPLEFDRALVNGRYDLVRRQATLEDLQLEFVGATLAGDGLVYFTDDGPGVRFFAGLHDLPFQWLKVYWPRRLGKGAYQWVSRNLTAGRVTEGQLRVHIDPEMWQAAHLPADAVDFSFAFVDTTAHYLRPMPPIIGGRGRARLDAQRFQLWADGGSTGGVSVGGSTIIFDDIHLGGGKSRANVDARLAGRLSDVLAVIDHQPLGYPSRYGLDPDAVDGQAQIKLKLSFPPVRGLTLGDVTFAVGAKIAALGIPDLFEDVGITDGQMQLDIDRGGIDGKGKVSLNDIPFDLLWREDFEGQNDYPTRFELTGSLSGDQWAVLSLPIADFVEGPGRVGLTLAGRGADIRLGEGSIDFQQASLGFEELGWSKPAGAPANARFRIATRPTGETELAEVIYADGGLRASGSMLLADNGGGLQQMVIDSLK